MLDGVGEKHAKIKVFIGNRPAVDWLQPIPILLPLTPGDIASIGTTCGNGWRKVFNVYAKLLFAVDRKKLPFKQLHPSWQAYRDDELLQAKSGTLLLFSKPDFSVTESVTIIMGRTYAKTLPLPPTLQWLNEEFAIDNATKTIVCPYFDYRQLSNIKITYLVELIESLV